MSSFLVNKWSENDSINKSISNVTNFSDLPSTPIYNKKSAELLSQPTFYTNVSKFGPKTGAWHHTPMPSSLNEKTFHIQSDEDCDDDVIILDEIHMSSTKKSHDSSMCQNKAEVSHYESSQRTEPPNFIEPLCNPTSIPFLDSVSDENNVIENLPCAVDSLSIFDVDDSTDNELYGSDTETENPSFKLDFSCILPSAINEKRDEQDDETFPKLLPKIEINDDDDVIVISDSEDNAITPPSTTPIIQGTCGNERSMPQLIPLHSGNEKQDNNNNISCSDGGILPISKSSPVEVIHVPSSPEMPRLIPFTSETEELPKGKSNSVEKTLSVNLQSSNLQPKVVLKKLSFDNCQMDKENLEKGTFPLSKFLKIENDFIYDPDIDIIDGLNFYSFTSRTEMESYCEVHADNMTFQMDDDDDDVDSVDSRCSNAIIPMKTNDITQIKGWKSKQFAPEKQIPFYHDPCEVMSDFSKDYEEKVDISEVSLEALDTFTSAFSNDKTDREIKNSAQTEVAKKTDSVGAFTSATLDRFLEVESELMVPLLQKVNPNITPILKNAPILSIGNLRKIENLNLISPGKFQSISYEKTEKNKNRKRNSNSLLESDTDKQSPILLNSPVKKKKQSAGILASAKVLKKSRQFKNKLESPSSPRLVLRIKKETSGTVDGYKVSNISSEIEQKSCVLLPKVKSGSPKGSQLFKDILFSEYNKVQEKRLLDEFLTNLNGRGSINDLTSLVNCKRTYCNTRVISAKDAVNHVSSVTSIKELRHKMEQDQSHLKKIKPQSKKVFVKKQNVSTDAVNKQESNDSGIRGKRSIRLPVRFLDSAIMVPGSEWVSPVMSSNDYESYVKTKKQTWKITEQKNALQAAGDQENEIENSKFVNSQTCKKIRKSNLSEVEETIPKSECDSLRTNVANTENREEQQSQNLPVKSKNQMREVCASVVLTSVGLKPTSSESSALQQPFVTTKSTSAKSLQPTHNPNKEHFPLLKKKRLSVKLSVRKVDDQNGPSNKSSNDVNTLQQMHSLSDSLDSCKRICYSPFCICKNVSRAIAYDVTTKRLRCKCMDRKRELATIQADNQISKSETKMKLSDDNINLHNYAVPFLKEVANSACEQTVRNTSSMSVTASKDAHYGQEVTPEGNYPVVSTEYRLSNSNSISIAGATNKFARIMLLSPQSRKTNSATSILLPPVKTPENSKLSTNAAIDIKKILVKKATPLPYISDVFYASSTSSNTLTKSTMSNAVSMMSSNKNNPPVVLTVSPDRIFRTGDRICMKPAPKPNTSVNQSHPVELSIVPPSSSIESSSSDKRNFPKASLQSIKVPPANQNMTFPNDNIITLYSASDSSQISPIKLNGPTVLTIKPPPNQNCSLNSSNPQTNVKLSPIVIHEHQISENAVSQADSNNTSNSDFNEQQNSHLSSSLENSLNSLVTSLSSNDDDDDDEAVDVENVTSDEIKQLRKELTKTALSNFLESLNDQSNSSSSSSTSSANEESECEEALSFLSDDENMKKLVENYKKDTFKKKVMERHRRFLIRKLCNDLRKCEPTLREEKSVKGLLDKATKIVKEVTATNLSMSFQVKILLLRREALLKKYTSLVSDVPAEVKKREITETFKKMSDAVKLDEGRQFPSPPSPYLAETTQKFIKYITSKGSSGINVNSLKDVNRHIMASILDKKPQIKEGKSPSKSSIPFVSNLRKRLMKIIDNPSDKDSSSSSYSLKTNKVKDLMRQLNTSGVVSTETLTPDIMDMRMNLKKKFEFHADSNSSATDDTSNLPVSCAEDQDISLVESLLCNENSVQSEEEAVDDLIPTPYTETVETSPDDPPPPPDECQKVQESVPSSSSQQAARHLNLPFHMSSNAPVTPFSRNSTFEYLKSHLNSSSSLPSTSTKGSNLVQRQSAPNPSHFKCSKLKSAETSSAFVPRQEQNAAQCPQLNRDPKVNKVVRSLSKWYSSFGVPVADDVLYRESNQLLHLPQETPLPLVVGDTVTHLKEN